MERFTSLDFFLDKFQYTYKKNFPLSNCCTFKIGGIANFVIYPESIKMLVDLLNFIKNNDINYVVVGNCSNILFSDNGYNGAVIITTRMKTMYLRDNILYAESGVSVTYAAVFAQKNNLSGLEFAYGIPGSIGGAIYMNAGAYDGEIKNVVADSSYYDVINNDIINLVGEKHNFDYRKSFYTNKNLIILSANLKLSYDNESNIKAKMDDFVRCRFEKQPLEYPSAGSIFKRYPGYFPAKLIEESNLKGFSIGGAQISDKHTGFIVNKGKASAKDVLDLIDHIQTTILNNYGINIECEIKYIE